MERIWSEATCDYFDDFDNVWCVDAWKTADDNEEGEVVATITEDGEVTYKNPNAKNCLVVQDCINEFLKELNN